MKIEELQKLQEDALEQIKKAKKEYDTIVSNFAIEEEYQIQDNSKNFSHLPVKIYSQGGENYMPTYATLGASGMDLRAFITEPITLQPLERKLIPTGIFVNLPDGYEFQIRPRSGLSFKRGLTLINCIGTIDDDYINEIFVPLVNLDCNEQTIYPAERIAQLVLSKVDKCELIMVNSTESFNSKDRKGGFGSTGNL
jgi:dUTP pyrophosphatase